MLPSRYPNSAECIWELRTEEPGYHLVLQFYDRFDVETAPGCTNDYVEILEYTASTGRWDPVGGRLCGRDIPANVTTRTERVRVVFRSNREIDGDGFKIYWELACGETFNGTTSGEFTSPGYPVAYKNNLRCDYKIIVKPSDFVNIEFIEPFTLEGTVASLAWNIRVKQLKIIYLYRTLRNMHLGLRHSHRDGIEELER